MSDNVTPFPDRNAPSPEFVHIDDMGRKMFFYTVTYTFDDGEWNVEFWAYDMADAEARLKAMRQTLGEKGCFQILDRFDA